MALHTWVARFVVDHGRVTEEGGRLRTFQRRRLDEPDVDLHLLAEPSGEKGEDLGSQALDAIGHAFLQDRLSLTGGLIRALRSTHQTLLDWNRRSLPRDQVSSGVTAAIVAGTVVHLAQAGPGLVFYRRDGRLSRLETEPAAATPLGEDEIEPSLRRIELAAGDVVIAASPLLSRIVDDEMLADLLDRGSDEALPELYLLTRDLPNFALFAVTCHEAPDEDDAPPEEAETSQASASLEASLDAGYDVFERGSQPAHRAEALPEPPPSAIEPAAARPATPQPRRWARRPAIPEPVSAPEPEPEEAPPKAPFLVAPPPLDISRTIVRLRSNASVSRSDYARTTGTASRFSVNLGDWRLLRLGAAIAVALLIVAFVPDLVREGRTEKLGNLIQSAEAQFAAAAAEQEPAAKRRLLDETRRLASEALRIDSLNQTASDLRQQAIASLGAMDAVFDLGPLTTVTTLSRQITGEVSIKAMSVAAGSAYLLDSKGGRVIAVSLTGGAPTVVYQQGASYSGTPAKSPVLLTWEASSGGGRLLVLDEERKLFQVTPGSLPEPLSLRRTTMWTSAAGIAAYDANLYVLDPKGNQVHRYLPAAGGFDSEPGPALSGPQTLADAEGIAVDGDVYIFFKDGRVRRYHEGADAGFDLAGIDRPLKTATGIALVPSAGEVYLADAGNKRVIVAAEDGTFRRQLVSNAFTDLLAIGVDPSGGQLYIAVGDALLTAPIVR